jgi:hypothetical protein
MWKLWEAIFRWERINPCIIGEEYLRSKQTYLQLAKKYKCSNRTIQRKIDLHQVRATQKKSRSVIVLMDTTYWGRSFGEMLFKDAIPKENLLKYYVRNETNFLYKKGVEELTLKGYRVIAIVSDGRKGLAQSFRSIPVQMCQFHQVAIIRRYITKNPKLPASIELKELVAMMKLTDKESFEGALNDWFLKWEDFLNERTISIETGRSYYHSQTTKKRIQKLEK